MTRLLSLLLTLAILGCSTPPARGALGDVTTTIAGRSFVVELLASAIAANGAPSSGTAGIHVNELGALGRAPDSLRVAIRSTAGQGTMTVTARVWLKAGGFWFVAKALSASSAAPQTAVALAETGANSIAWSEDVQVVAGAERLYLEITAIAGDAAAKAELDVGTPSADIDTIVRAKTAGTAGNSITLAAVADGTGTGTLTLDGSAYTFHYQNDTTTVANFETLVTASTLLEVKTTGTGATVLNANDAFAATPLAGGIDAHAVTGYAIVGRP